MKLQQLIQILYYEPSLITAEAHESIRRLIESRLGDDAGAARLLNPDGRQPGEGPCGEKVEVAQMEIIDGIAHIPIGGAIGKNLSPFNRGQGGVDVADVTDELNQAEDNPEVESIILDFDSPGGMVSGTPELAQRIERVKKPIVSYTAGMMASAAYWLGSATQGVFSTMTASVGSIGVYIPWIDQTKRFEKAGLKVELIKAGTLKGMGFPGTELTEAHREHLQDRVDEIYRMFTEHVTKHRMGVEKGTMQGQTFMGYQAMKLGLVDGIVDGKADVVQMLKS